MSNLYDIGKSGLQSYRQSLAITGQNIANINTDGYKRRGAELEEMSATKASALEAGQGTGMGVRIGVIKRAFDEFLLNKARSATAYAESTSTFVNATSQIEDILLPGEANIGNMIGRFFEGLQEVASDPADLVGRTVAIEQAKQVADGFVHLSSLMEEMKDGLNVQANHTLDEANLLTKEIDKVNRQLASGSPSKANNSLLDARDKLIDKLNEYIEVHVTLNERGAAKVTLGDSSNGPVLLSPTKIVELGVEKHRNTLNFLINPMTDGITTNKVTGGSLHGLASAYATAVEVLEEVDRLAFTMIRDINAIHNSGLTLEGEKGGDFFQSLRLDLEASPANTGEASAKLTVINPEDITPDKVLFNYDANENIWRATAEDGSLLGKGRTTIRLGGIDFDFRGTAAQFDQFVYNPVAGSAGGVALAIRRAEDIAAASSIITSSNANNKNQVILDAKRSNVANDVQIPSIEDAFSNGISAVAATEFIASGSVAYIPSNVSTIDLLSLRKQSQAQFSLSESDLNELNNIVLKFNQIDDSGNTVSKTLTFDVTFKNVKGFEGNWRDADQIVDYLNRGFIKGSFASAPSTMVSLTEAGGFSSGSGGFLNFSHSDAEYTAAEATKASGNNVEAVTSASVPDATDIHIFTREGRHIAGSAPDANEIIRFTEAMTESNGFNSSAEYVGDYLNGSGEDGYLGITVQNLDQAGMLVDLGSSGSKATATFSVFEGVDTNETSVNGLSSVSQTIDYQLTVGGLSGSVSGFDISEPSPEAVASSMIEKLRADAPIAYKVGVAATPNKGDELLLTFEGLNYTVSFEGGEAIVSGGEPGRLKAFFDSSDRLHVVSKSGTIGKSEINVLLDNDLPENEDVATRLGFLSSLSQTETRFSDESLFVAGTGAVVTSDVGANIITLTFSEDDAYNLKIVFDDHPNSGTTASTDKEITVSGSVSGDASAIANAINNAIAGNQSAGGSDISSGVAVASYVGKVVTLSVRDGKSVEIFRNGSEISSGDGTVTINAVTAGLDPKKLDDAYVAPGPGFELVRQGGQIIADSSTFKSKSFSIDSDELMVGDTIEIAGVDVTLTAATVSNLVEKINDASSSIGLRAHAEGDVVTLFGKTLEEVSIGYKTRSEIEANFNAATTRSISAGSTASANVNVVLHANDVVVGRTYELSLAAGSSSIGATTVSYKAQTGDNAQGVMRGLRDALRDADILFKGSAATTLDSESVAGTLTIADDLNYGDADISFGIDSSSINHVFGESGDQILASGATQPTLSNTGTSLASQRLILSDLPSEELIVFLGESGARRVALQFDEAPNIGAEIQRNLEIRVKNAAENIVEVFDEETGTSIATRTLNSDGETHALGFDLMFNGIFDEEDRFHISGNADGKGDNRNLQNILDLQAVNYSDTSVGGFQKVYNKEVSRLGAIVQSGKIAAEAATALKEASIEAESAYSGVNLDTEAANLIQQQQAYQASARILSTARELFDALIRVV